MKKLLDWQSPEVVNIFDEFSIWSSTFGRLLLEHIPMQKGWTVMDLGFGTGFPLIELSQRFGNASTIYGVDIWKAAIDRTKEKIETLGIENIQILEASAEQLDLPDQHINLITSNLGVNNFENRDKVYQEVYRLLKPDGRLCITTNPIGTFEELFDLFVPVFKELELQEALEAFYTYLSHRNTKEQIIQEFELAGLGLLNSVEDETSMRFVDASALLNHSLIRIGFRSYWEEMIGEVHVPSFFTLLIEKIEQIIQTQGAFEIRIPMLYLEFGRKD